MKQTKNLLIIGPIPPPFGGIAVQIENTTPFLCKDFDKVRIVSFTNEKRASKNNNVSLNKYVLKKELSLFKIIKNLPLSFKVVAHCFRHKLNLRSMFAHISKAIIINDHILNDKITIIHYFMLDEAFLSKIFKDYYPNVVQITTIYGEIWENKNFYINKMKLLESILDSMDHLFSASKFCASSVEHIGLSNYSIEPLYYGVDLEYYNPSNSGAAIRKKYLSNDNQKLVLFFARLLPEMGADVLAESADEILKNNPESVLLVAGADGECSKLFRELENKHTNRLFLKIDVPNEEKPGLYASADLLIAPTRQLHACMGMSIKEAMASGVANISSNSGGIPEAVVDGETGILLKTGDDLRVKPGDLVNSIDQILNDDKKRKLMGEKSRARAESIFNNKNTANRLRKVYKDLIEQFLS